MNYQELRGQVIRDAFPLGAPENLTDWINTAILSAVIEVQRSVVCLQTFHDDVYDACQTFWHCGTTVITKPNGEIRRVYTVDASAGENWCNPVVLQPVSLAEIRRWTYSWRTKWSANYYVAPSSGLNLPRGFDVPNATSDCVAGRALAGVYAIDGPANRLIIGPWIQSTEKLVVEWSGIKRTWADGDLVCSDPDYIRLIRLWVELEYARKWMGSNIPIAQATYSEALSDMIIACNRSRHVGTVKQGREELEAIYLNNYAPEAPVEVVEPSSESVIAFVGDYGTADSNAQAVADAVTALGPDLVVSLGDNRYDPNDAITAMAPYASFIDAGKFRASLGNHDLDDGHLGSAVTSYAQNPGNGRYFSFTQGPVGIHVINTGINTAGQYVEPDGNFAGSKQYNAICAAILRDTSKWKVVVMHHPGYTSDTSYYPGRSVMRWAHDLPVHAVLCGHAHNYERLVVRGRLILIAGTGGGGLRGFHSPVYPGSQLQLQTFGYLRLTCDCDSATFEFVNTAGTVLDSVDISGLPVLAPADANADPIITLHPSSETVAFGGDVILEGQATGTNPITYQWLKDGVELPGETNSTLALYNVTQTATYSFRAQSALGATISRECTVGACTALTTTYIYWGTGGDPTTESDILGLNSQYAESANTIKAFTAGQYRIFAWPDFFGSPRQYDGFIDPATGFAFGMAGTAEGYTHSENGWNYKLMTVGGRVCRVYRSFNPIGAAHSIQVQT